MLLVGHHGSGSSTSQAWLNQVRPRLAVLNNAYGNRFGHPHPTVMARLGASGSTGWEVWRSGAVRISFNSEGVPHAVAWRGTKESWWK